MSSSPASFEVPYALSGLVGEFSPYATGDCPSKT